MSNTFAVSIYTEPLLVSKHNPLDNLSLENGQRVKINVGEYRLWGCRIVYPDLNTISINFLANHSRTNPVYEYLTKTNFHQNLIQKLLNLRPASMKIRNCHGCTIETTDRICKYCESPFQVNHFFRYAYAIDSNISDSDTTYLTHTSLEAVQYSVSLVCQMVIDIYQNKTKYGFAFVRPPGHHASCTKSSGFCLVNNIAIAADLGTSIGYERIAIFDFDAHHGDGTQEIFYHRPDVFYCSIHTADAFPQTGKPEERGEGLGKYRTLNLIVEKHIEHQRYLDVFYDHAYPAIQAFSPDLILVSAGFDGLETDPMNLMKLKPQTYGLMVKQLKAIGVPIGLVLEGGYDLEGLNECYSQCIRALLDN